MAYILTNNHYSIISISKNMEEVKSKESRWQTYQLGICGHLVEISDSDFLAVQNSSSSMSFDGTNVSLTASPIVDKFKNEEQLQDHINNLIKNIDARVSNYSEGSFKQEVLNYKEVLKSIDTSSISYPMKITLEQYLLNQNKPIVGYLQL